MEAIEYSGSFEQYLCEKATLAHIPINAILELTPLCNMNCKMCFVRLGITEMKQKGELCSTEEWIALGEEMQKAGTMFVLFTGGEPLLHPGFKDIYIALKKMGIVLTINTNGTLIDEKWGDFFAQYPPRRINITLYGKDEHTYKTLCSYPEGFQKTLHAIKLLQERKIDVKINGSITPDNVNDVDQLVDIVEKLGAVWKFDTYMYPASRERCATFQQDARMTAKKAAQVRVELMKKRMTEEEFINFANEFSQKVKKSRGEYISMPVSCRAGRSSFIINWQGEMRPCVMMTEPSVPVFKYGFRTSWEKIVEKVANIKMSPECSACCYRDVCQTCAACAFLESGFYDGIPEYMCEYTEETLKQLKGEIRNT
ncbi:MAG TPA: radical SAM protein [Candidatus Blautia stercoripullorum]|uniref:Radical SAM protein n=1 Tax=Candidatus Blautia stercoripullorum TaxID=2838502 RepID=A0A9D2RBL8_9FIRM|nr:radical SAM protein [Candidatus Blautia stercoripullorum]